MYNILYSTLSNSQGLLLFFVPAAELTNPCSILLSLSADASAGQSGHSAANARKRFTLQGLSNRRSLPAGNSDASGKIIIVVNRIIVQNHRRHRLLSLSSSS